MTVATCNICKQFSVPWGDWIGEALMGEHFKEKHPLEWRKRQFELPAPQYNGEGEA